MRVIWTSLLAVVACGPAESARSDSSRVPRDTSAPPQAPREIYIDSVKGTNPLVVYGRARTFENTVQVRARDAGGREMVEAFTTSVGEMGHHNPYSAELWLSRHPGPDLTVEAFEYSAMDGSVRSLTSRRLAFGGERMPVALMFPVGDSCTETRAFTRTVPHTVAVSRLLVEALVSGPDSVEQKGGARSLFPKGSRARSVVLRAGTLTVDFDERLQNVGGSCAATAIRQSVTRTLLHLPTVRQVVITAGGSEKLALQP